MDVGAIKRASELFQGAADLPRHERGAYLKARCDDEKLLQFVLQMLADHEKQSGGPLDAPVLDGVRGAMPAMPSLPTRLGGYDLVRVLGEGGMAVVYEARQQNPSRVVALKVLKPGVLSAELLRRFQHEIQVLGHLQHEGIAHIYEADVAEAVLADGSVVRQPYFAMELIRGEPLNTYAQKHALTDAEKLELVAKVCDAVQYAHQRGVIHRDLKPANILVEDGESRRDEGTKSDAGASRSGDKSVHGGARPRVLDFGVARVTGAELDAPTMNTEAGRLIGTLAYMSPEQVGGEVDQTDTRSDVYALGVILYELLSGRLPHDIRDLPLPEAARRVREEEPARLSALDRRFRGDIDVIVARAMDKERARRYSSAMELGADLRRCLAGEAIEARRDSAIYVLRKGLRRYRGLVAASGAVLVGLAAFAVYASVQAHRFETLSGNEHKARVAAESVNKFLAGVIELANPDPGRGYALTLTDMLDDATHRLEKGELAGDPDVEAQVRTTLAQTYENLELTDGTILHQKWLVDYHRKHGGGQSQEYLDALTSLGNSYVEGGGQPEGRETLKQALELARAIHGAESLQAFKIMDTIGNSLMREGRSPEALEYSLPATQGVERLMGPEHYETGFVYFNLAGVYRGLRRTQDMINCYDKALKILDAYPNDLGTLRLRWTYATDVFRRRGKLDEAEAYLRHAVELAVKAQGADHPETLQTQRALAGVLFEKGQTEDAKRILVQAIETCRAVRRWASPTEFALTSSVVVVLRGRKEFDEAAERLAATIERFEKARGRADRMLLLLMIQKSAVEKDRDHREAAAVILEDAAQRLVEDGKGEDVRVKQWRGEAVVVRQGS